MSKNNSFETIGSPQCEAAEPSLEPVSAAPIQSVVYTRNGVKAVQIRKDITSKYLIEYLPQESLIYYSDLSISFGEVSRGDDEYRAKERLSLVSSWVGFLGKSLQSQVGSELTSQFEELLSDFQRTLLSRGLSKKTVQNKASVIRALQAHYAKNRLSVVKEMPSDFRGRLVFFMAIKGVRPEDLAKLVGRGIKDWIKPDGSMPQKHRYDKVRQVEEYLKVPSGMLLDLLPKAAVPIMQLKADLTHRNYVHKLSRENRFYLKELPPQIKSVWEKIKAHKSAPSLSAVDPVTGMREMKVVSGFWKSSATANMALEHLCRFFGYLMLPKDENWELLTPEAKLLHGRYGFKLEELQFVHILNNPMMCDFLEYSMFRGNQDNYSSRDRQMLDFCLNLISRHRDTAFFRLNHVRASLLGLPQEGFGEWMDNTYDQLNRTRKTVEKAKAVRNVKSNTLGDLLLDDDYLDKLFEIPDRIVKAATPFQVSPWHFAKAYRDALLVEILLFKPIRRAEVAKMTIGERLTQDTFGNWTLFISKHELKNHHSPHAEDLRVAYPESLSKRISEYIKKYRPAIVGGKPIQVTQLFITGDSKKGANALSEDEITRRFMSRFKQFFGLSIGPHAMRDLIATAYLKRYPGDFAAAATLLNNSEQMVRKHYDKTTRADANKRSARFQDTYLKRGSV